MNKIVAAAATLIVVGAVATADAILVPVLLAALFSLALNPPVKRLVQTGLFPRPVAAAVVLFGVASALVALGVALREPVIALVKKAPTVIRDIMRMLDSLGTTLTGRSARGRGAMQPDSETVMDVAGAVAVYISDAALVLGIALVLTYFMLSWGDTVARAAVCAMQAREERRAWLHVGGVMQRGISRYLATITLVNVAVAAVTALTLFLLGNPHALVLGVIAGLFNFMPFIGAMITLGLITLASTTEQGLTLAAMSAPLAFLLLHLLEGQFLTPRLLGRWLILNPLVVIVGVFTGAALWGLSGAFLAVPLLTVLKVAADSHPRWRRWGQVLGRGSLPALRNYVPVRGARLVATIRRRSSGGVPAGAVGLPLAPAAPAVAPSAVAPALAPALAAAAAGSVPGTAATGALSAAIPGASSASTSRAAAADRLESASEIA